jgi:hypothetical protein
LTHPHNFTSSRSFSNLNNQFALSKTNAIYRQNDSQPEHFGIDAGRLKENNIVCMRAIMKMLWDGRRAWTKLAEDAAAVANKVNNKPLNLRGYDYEDFLKEKRRRRDAGELASTYSRRKNRFESKIDWMESDYVRCLIKAFPKDGARVREILMSSGYASEVACRDLLLRTVGQEKKMNICIGGFPNWKNQRLAKNKNPWF